MTNMNLYDALIEIGVSKENARKTAESIDASEPRFDALDRKIDRLGAELNGKIDRLGAELNGKIDLLRADLINRFEPRFVKIEGDMTMMKWMFGILIAGVVTLILKAFSH